MLLSWLCKIPASKSEVENWIVSMDTWNNGELRGSANTCLFVLVAVPVASCCRKASESKYLFKQVSQLMRKWPIKASDIFQCVELNS